MRGTFAGQGVARMKALRRKVEAGDDSEVLAWVIPRALACAHRPLRHHPLYGGSGLPIPREAHPLILDWVEQVRMESIASIITFMHDRDLLCYQQIDLGGLTFRNLSIRTRQWVPEFTVVAAPPVWWADVDELRGHAPISVAACSSQYVMPISRYIVVAMPRCS